MSTKMTTTHSTPISNLPEHWQRADTCVHFTGTFCGVCRAGIAYSQVEDRSRRDQMARYPCSKSLDSFTTCERAQFLSLREARRSISLPGLKVRLTQERINKRVVVLPGESWRREKLYGTLIGFTRDRQKVFVEAEDGQRHAFPSHLLRWDRRKEVMRMK